MRDQRTGDGEGVRVPAPCAPDFLSGVCQSYRPGHHVHQIHAGRVGARPWGWRDGVVASLTGDGWVVVEYVLEAGRMRGWHHRDLRSRLAVGDPVRVHEQYYVLGAPFGWCNLWIDHGLGAVPEPADTDAWSQETTGGAVDLATGYALPLDHVGPDDE